MTEGSSSGPQVVIKPRDLSRVKIITAGVSLLDGGGTAAVTMRSLAEVLGVTPMAIYNHVDDKTDLLRAIAAHLLDTAQFDDGCASWRGRIEYCFRQFRALCQRHPGLAGLLETADIAPSSVFAPMEVTVEALRSIGFDDVNALRGYFTLVSFTLGQVAYQHRGPFPDLTPAHYAREGSTAALHAGTGETWDFDAAFEFGLRLILDGAEAARRQD